MTPSTSSNISTLPRAVRACLPEVNGTNGMADDREQRDKLMELMGKEPTRRIHLAVLAFLVLSGMALQRLAWWYKVQAVREEWAAVAVQVWPVAIGIWILTVCLTLALLWKRLKDMQKGRTSEDETRPT